jgi:cytochrome c peroxidase
MPRFLVAAWKRTHPKYALPLAVLLLIVSLASLLAWLLSAKPVTPATGTPRAARPLPITASSEPIQPIPEPPRLDPRKVELGNRLFHDPRLSRDNSVACATCHSLSQGGTDHRTHSVGIDGQVGQLNSPTVFNSALNFRQFWDGRAETLEGQVDGPTHNPAEMGSSWPDIVAKLSRDPLYLAAFAGLYRDGVQPANIRDAIATFERSLTTPNSRFDRFLRGEATSITEEEKAGYALFKTLGCVACHQGAAIGGNMFQKFGVMGDYFADRGHQTSADLGRFNVTGRDEDRHTFKVPSLRNVARTAPYFHDGSARTLEEAVAVMAKYQLGRTLSRSDVELLVKFLNALTGEYNGRPL